MDSLRVMSNNLLLGYLWVDDADGVKDDEEAGADDRQRLYTSSYQYYRYTEWS